MRLLIDTNIVLEVILEQTRADEARALLAATEEHQFFISDYALHSIGLLLFRRGQHSIFLQFLNDMMVKAGMVLTSLHTDDMEAVVEMAMRLNLDFDVPINMLQQRNPI